jgi:hypothetical protein
VEKTGDNYAELWAAEKKGEKKRCLMITVRLGLSWMKNILRHVESEIICP